MKVRITTSFVEKDGYIYSLYFKDDIVDMPNGKKWIECGFAEKVQAVKKRTK